MVSLDKHSDLPQGHCVESGTGIRAASSVLGVPLNRSFKGGSKKITVTADERAVFNNRLQSRMAFLENVY